ncbi:iron-sulfur protein [Sphaerisporangium rufum]|uniref:Cytochrome bc1 complex Rieske iron-sulfur subunit n=1 Tax=Sphaerisporangium rufum TaxID=1381558 RepID=A0A919R545_9ACTN|nr:Rieske (2Fe-2S) protein [Sphaerisporangium rufum]GII79298.1 iron-sulfur protein [Sphaerisporangium rufum]
MSDRDTTRRAMLLGASGTGLAAVLTACGGYGSSPSVDDDAPAGEAPPTGTAGADSGAGGGAPLAKTADIPKGGGKIFKDQKLVITQTSAGEFKAFSSICTHQGCPVGSVSDGTINCPCHGSKFSIEDGSVTGGPAPEPLPAKQIKVDGDSISLA